MKTLANSVLKHEQARPTRTEGEVMSRLVGIDSGITPESKEENTTRAK